MCNLAKRSTRTTVCTVDSTRLLFAGRSSMFSWCLSRRWNLASSAPDFYSFITCELTVYERGYDAILLACSILKLILTIVSSHMIQRACLRSVLVLSSTPPRQSSHSNWVDLTWFETSFGTSCRHNSLSRVSTQSLLLIHVSCWFSVPVKVRSITAKRFPDLPQFLHNQ